MVLQNEPFKARRNREKTGKRKKNNDDDDDDEKRETNELLVCI